MHFCQCGGNVDLRGPLPLGTRIFVRVAQVKMLPSALLGAYRSIRRNVGAARSSRSAVAPVTTQAPNGGFRHSEGSRKAGPLAAAAEKITALGLGSARRNIVDAFSSAKNNKSAMILGYEFSSGNFWAAVLFVL